MQEALFTKNWIVLPNAAQVANDCANMILTAAAKAISKRGEFRLVLTGGRTPLAAYRLLARTDTDWSMWKLYFGDERCVGAGHPERNSLSAMDAWLGKVAVPPSNIYPIPAEKGAAIGASEYAQTIADAMPFDMVLLGIGEDGHVASLFPDRPESAGLVIPVHDSPKPPSERVSLNYRALSDAERVLIMVTGSGKRDAVKHWEAGDNLPVSRITARKQLDVVLDREAAQNNP